MKGTLTTKRKFQFHNVFRMLELFYRTLLYQARRNRRTGVSVRRFGIEPDKKCNFCIKNAKIHGILPPEAKWVEGVKLILKNIQLFTVSYSKDCLPKGLPTRPTRSVPYRPVN